MPGSEAQGLEGKLGGEVCGPRTDALSWDDYFMSVAYLTAMRSKDPATQVGACIVNDLNRIIGVGYNGLPSGVPNESLSWARESPEGELATKYPYVVHAELNAIMNKNAESCRNCRLYSTLHPCNECAKVIIQSGIKCVTFSSDKHHDRPSFVAARKLFKLAGVETRRFSPQKANLQINLRDQEEEPWPEPLTCPPCGTTEDQGQWPFGAHCLQCGSYGALELTPELTPELTAEAAQLTAEAAQAKQLARFSVVIALGMAAVAVMVACRR
uniref:dCMP deaminase n=1 Tax=Alexandrium catenella TaxID=2925 RepID=A0A7S1MC63_ALECA